MQLATTLSPIRPWANHSLINFYLFDQLRNTFISTLWQALCPVWVQNWLRHGFTWMCSLLPSKGGHWSCPKWVVTSYLSMSNSRYLYWDPENLIFKRCLPLPCQEKRNIREVLSSDPLLNVFPESRKCFCAQDFLLTTPAPAPHPS